MKQKILCSLLVFFVLLSAPVDAKNRRKRPPKTNEFDILILAQQWPMTVCYDWVKGNSKHNCSFPAEKNEWAIHGLWPTRFNTIGPANCANLPFNETALNPIYNELKEKWVNVEFQKGNYSLWKHEWLKHGTCSATIPELNTEVKYFQKTMELFKEYDMKKILSKVNIVPGKSYPVNMILTEIKKSIEKNVAVECLINHETKDRYLQQIRLCFNKTLTLVDCTGIKNLPTNCSRRKNITYLDNLPLNIEVTQI